MGLFDKIKGPVILKESSAMDEQLAALVALKGAVPPEVAKKIEKDIQAIEAGNLGENSILFELKNSHIPMLVLHDLCLVHKGLTSQIDFMVITRKHIFVIECKNLYGNIEVNNKGDFVRTKNVNGRYIKEGIYSPITQNQRHLELIKQIRAAERGNIVTRALFEKGFYDAYIPVVVLANSKTVLNDKYAKKDVKAKIVRADQLVNHILCCDAKPDVLSMSEKEMERLAKFFLGKHEPNAAVYTERYAFPPVETTLSQVSEAQESSAGNAAPSEQIILCPKCGAIMKKRVASRGSNAGKEFYGCSKYPKCRGIVNIG